jgi:hypothetical protein
MASHRQDVAKALLRLEQAIEALVDALSHRPVIANIDATSTGRSAIRSACEAYSTINYDMQGEVGDSVICLGVLGVQTDVAKRAQIVNEAKSELKSLFAPLQRVRIRVPVKDSTTKAIPALRVILRNIQRSDLNVHAAYRKIPILSAAPKSVSYTRANTRSVYRKTVEEIADMLSNLSSSTAATDREQLATLDRRVSHLALVRYHYQNIRANVVYARLDSRGRGRIQIGAELPLVYPTGRRTEIPEVHFPAADNSQPKRTRTSKLEPQPFLRSLPVYRYS